MVVAEYFGCKFPPIARYDGRVTATFGFFLTPEIYEELGKYVNRPVRLKLADTVLTADNTDGSYRYGNEFQIHSYTYYAPIVEQRAHCKDEHISRIELPMKEHEGNDFFFNVLDHRRKLLTVAEGPQKVAEWL